MIPIRSPSIWRPNPRASGYAALVSTLIMAAIITVVSLELGGASLSQRLAIANDELSRQALQLAHGCSDFALVQLSYDAGYSGNQDHNIAGQTCRVGKLAPFASHEMEFIASAQLGHAVAHLDTIVSTDSWQVVSQMPVSHY